MDKESSDQITHILEAINSGDREAVHALFPVVYQQLHRMARSKMSREPGQTLQTTALVHEVYLRLVNEPEPHWENRKHFFSIAAEAMRRILVENARRRSAVRRGANPRRITLKEDILKVDSDPERLLIVDQALTRLQTIDMQMAEVVKLRCFAGLTVNEAALALGISVRSVDRLWAGARAWLFRELMKSTSPETVLT